MIHRAVGNLTRGIGKFDGANDIGVVTVGTTPMNIQGDITITTWFKYTPTTIADRSIIVKHSASDNYSMATTTGGAVRFGPNTTSRLSTPAVNDQLWHYIAFSYTHATKTVNGQCDFTALNPLVATNAAVPNNLNWTIGANNAGTLWIAAQFAELRFYNRVLTFEEMRNNAHGRETNGLVGEYLFKEGTGTVVANNMDASTPINLTGTTSTFWPTKEVITR